LYVHFFIAYLNHALDVGEHLGRVQLGQRCDGVERKIAMLAGSVRWTVDNLVEGHLSNSRGRSVLRRRHIGPSFDEGQEGYRSVLAHMGRYEMASREVVRSYEFFVSVLRKLLDSIYHPAGFDCIPQAFVKG
jgi:hypothetical protein